MAFMTSNTLFDNVFGDEPEKTPSEIFITELISYLKNKHSSPLARKMGVYLEKGGACTAFSCREDVFSDVAEELYEKELPYAATATLEGRFGFLVREADKEKAYEACNNVLERRSRTCLVMTGEEIMKQAAFSREADRSCIAIHGLASGQARLIQEKYALYIDAAKIGLDHMEDGTVTLTVFAKDAIKKNLRKGPDLCTIYMETILASNGPNGVRNQAYAELRVALQNKLAVSFNDEISNLNKTPLWVVGQGTQYLTIKANSFSYGRAIIDDDNVQFKTFYQADIAQPDYRQMLISFTERIPFPLTTYNQSEVLEHFRQQKSGGVELDLLDSAPDSKYRMYARGEKQLAKQIDLMITRKIQNDPIMQMDGRQNEKFTHYVEEFQSMMKAIIIGRMPEGYELADVKVLNEIMNKHKLDGEMYEQSLIALQSIEAVAITTTIDRIADVAEKIVEEKDAREREIEKQRKARETRTRGRTHSTPEK